MPPKSTGAAPFPPPPPPPLPEERQQAPVGTQKGRTVAANPQASPTTSVARTRPAQSPVTSRPVLERQASISEEKGESVKEPPLGGLRRKGRVREGQNGGAGSKGLWRTRRPGSQSGQNTTPCSPTRPGHPAVNRGGCTRQKKSAADPQTRPHHPAVNSASRTRTTACHARRPDGTACSRARPAPASQSRPRAQGQLPHRDIQPDHRQGADRERSAAPGRQCEPALRTGSQSTQGHHRAS